MKRVTLEDGTVWPDPYSKEYGDLMHKLLRSEITESERYGVFTVLEAYATLIQHPAFTLRRVAKIVSGIRKNGIHN